MFIQFLVEDVSGEKLLHAIMTHYNEELPHDQQVNYGIRSYKGIGGFKKGQNVQTVVSNQLLGDLEKRLRAFEAALKHLDDAALLIVLDNDKRNTEVFRAELKSVAEQAGITIRHVFCIAIEEMEAWLLGDENAIRQAYPKIADRISGKLVNYVQDDICGTWEFLADIITRKGIGQFNKENPSWVDVGKQKSEWAQRIGVHLSIRNNRSPSFNAMLAAMDQFLATG